LNKRKIPSGASYALAVGEFQGRAGSSRNPLVVDRENRTNVGDIEMTVENDPAWERYNNALAVIRAHVALDKAGDEIDPKFHG
jgi:hypothetical protein